MVKRIHLILGPQVYLLLSGDATLLGIHLLSGTRASNKFPRLGLELKDDLSSPFQGHFTIPNYAFSSSSSSSSFFLHSETLIIYLSGIELGQSIQFPLMKYPSHFEIFGSITSPSISVFSALPFKVLLYCWRKNVFLSFSLK